MRSASRGNASSWYMKVIGKGLQRKREVKLKNILVCEYRGMPWID